MNDSDTQSLCTSLAIKPLTEIDQGVKRKEGLQTLDDTDFCEAENELVLSRVHRWVCDGTLLAAGFILNLSHR